MTETVDGFVQRNRLTWVINGFSKKAHKEYFEAKGREWNVSRKAARGKVLSERDKKWNRTRSRVRAKGEHPFGVVKHLWRYARTRYRGIEKNAAQIFSLFALANLYLVRKELIGA